MDACQLSHLHENTKNHQTIIRRGPLFCIFQITQRLYFNNYLAYLKAFSRNVGEMQIYCFVNDTSAFLSFQSIFWQISLKDTVSTITWRPIFYDNSAKIKAKFLYQLVDLIQYQSKVYSVRLITCTLTKKVH